MDQNKIILYDIFQIKKGGNNMFNNFVKMISRVHIWIKQNITKKGSKEASIEL
jgi:hypothetical protein